LILSLHRHGILESILVNKDKCSRIALHPKRKLNNGESPSQRSTSQGCFAVVERIKESFLAHENAIVAGLTESTSATSIEATPFQNTKVQAAHSQSKQYRKVAQERARALSTLAREEIRFRHVKALKLQHQKFFD
jgi:hypothetical protein